MPTVPLPCRAAARAFGFFDVAVAVFGFVVFAMVRPCAR